MPFVLPVVPNPNLFAKDGRSYDEFKTARLKCAEELEKAAAGRNFLKPYQVKMLDARCRRYEAIKSLNLSTYTNVVLKCNKQRAREQDVLLRAQSRKEETSEKVLDTFAVLSNNIIETSTKDLHAVIKAASSLQGKKRDFHEADLTDTADTNAGQLGADDSGNGEEIAGVSELESEHHNSVNRSGESGADDADEANRTVDPPVESVSSGEPESSDGCFIRRLLARLRGGKSETAADSSILFLNDPVVRASLDKADRVKARQIWTARSSAYGCFRSIHKGEELANLSPDLQAAYNHVGDLRQTISQSLSLDEAYNRELMIPMLAEGQRHHMRTITLAVRRMIQAQFAKWACGPLPGRVTEAGVMREDWDGLFDPLTSGIVYTGPAEETVLASKARKVAEADSTNRGKQADKCWKLASGLEVCWLEAAKEDDAENPTKYESDLLKVLKGGKDMADRIFHKTRICAEVFGIVTSRHDAQLLSVVRLRSGVCIGHELARFSAHTHSFHAIIPWIQTIRTALCLVHCLETLADQLQQPGDMSDTDSGDESIEGHEVTFPTPKAPSKSRSGGKNSSGQSALLQLPDPSGPVDTPVSRFKRIKLSTGRAGAPCSEADNAVQKIDDMHVGEPSSPERSHLRKKSKSLNLTTVAKRWKQIRRKITSRPRIVG